MPRKMGKRHFIVALRLSRDECDKLEVLAEATERTKSGVLRYLLRQAAASKTPDLYLAGLTQEEEN